jgi:hypothetical protein
LDEAFLKTYMPYSLEQLPAVAWQQAKIGDKLFAVPKGNASFSNYDFVTARQDLIEKYNLPVPKDWASFKEFLKALAQHTAETGVVPLHTNANRNQTLEPYMQANGYDLFTEGIDFMYNAGGKEELPPFEGVEFIYASELYKNYALECLELARAGAWSKDAINDTNDATGYFENGTSGAIAWNASGINAGIKLEAAGLGTYACYDISPDFKMARARYYGDMIAIASHSKNPERAALALDYMKSDPDLNHLLLGGVKGTHFDLNAQGQRVKLDAAANYTWNGWAWALNRADEPIQADTDPRQLTLEEHINSRELFAKVAGFTFDSAPVSTELSVVNSIVTEYENSFALGIYGDDTVKKFETFKASLEAAGLPKITQELKAQYEKFKAANQ